VNYSAGPFTPDEAYWQHVALLPREVYEAVNRLLAEKFNKEVVIRIQQSEVVNLIVDLMKRDCKAISYIDVFEKGWLQKIPEAYETKSWKVEYHIDDKSDPYWIFEKA